MLSVLTARDGSTFRVTLVGDLDLSNAAELDRVLREAVSSGAAQTCVDLRQLRFIDSTGLQLLLTADRDARAAGHALVLRRGSAMVQRVFEVCGLEDAFTFAAS